MPKTNKSSTIFNVFKNTKGGAGFTLIELLVVISIISFLAAFAIYRVNFARIKARDAFRTQEINVFHKQFEICYGDLGDYPDSTSPQIWDRSGTGWKYSFSCGPCHGNFKKVVKDCMKIPPEDPINTSAYAYYYFYFEPDATNYYGAPINDACKGHYAFMAHLELSTHENAICFDQPNHYEYWVILGH